MLAGNNQAQNYPLATRILIACGAIGPILFVLVFLIEGATRPGYSQWRNFVSDLSESSQGWVQIVNFIMCGVLVFCFAFGLRQVLRSGKGAVWGPRLLGIFGLLLIIAGLFVTDPSLGYPPGTSSNMQTLHGTIHGVNAPLTFGSLAMAIFVLARRFASDATWRGWTFYSVITGMLLVGFFTACLVVALLDQKGILPDAPVGLLERIAIVLGWGWISLFALKLLLQMILSNSLIRSQREADTVENRGLSQGAK